MRRPQLKLRMAVMGAVLFGLYAALVAVFQSFLSLPAVIAGTVLFAVAQCALGKCLVLRSVGAEPLPEDRFGHIHSEVADLCADIDVPKPDLRVAHMGVPNAFAVGRKGAGGVVVSELLLDLLEDDEMTALVAHELAHIPTRDVIMVVIGQSIASMLGLTVFWILALAEDSIVGALCIFGGKRGLLDMLFASHPPTERRIERLAPATLDRRDEIAAELTR